MRRKPKRAGPTAALRAAPGRRFGAGFIALLAGTILLKLIVMWQLKDHPLTQPDAGLDTTVYVSLARRVMRGDLALGPGLYFVSPLYIYVLAGLLGLTRTFTAVRFVQVVLGTAAVACVYVMATEWYGRRAGWIAAILTGLTGLFAFYESLLLQAGLDPFLTAMALMALTLALKHDSRRWYFASGLVFGIQALNRPNIALAALAIAFGLAAVQRFRRAAVFVAALALALVPVTARNVAVTGTWSPVSSHGGLNFYIGNHANADGTYSSVAGIRPNLDGQQEDARRVAEHAEGRALDDHEVSAYFYRLGWTWIRENPVAAASLFGRKLSLIFSSADIWLNYSYSFFKKDAHTALPALLVGPWILIPLGLMGVVVAAPRESMRQYVVWASFVPVYAVAVAMFFVSDRYALPLLVPLCAAAGGGIDWFARTLRDGSKTRVVTFVAAFLAVFAVVNRPVDADDGVAEERVRMAERLVTLKRYAEAEAWVSRAERIDSMPGLVHFRVGQRLLAEGQMAPAIAHFEKALEFDPGQLDVEFALGEALFDAERPAEAAVHLRRAFDRGFQIDVAGYDLARALGATGERTRAIEVVRRLSGIRAGDAEYCAAVGELALKLQDPPLAAELFRKAIAARPEFAAAYLGLAVAEATLGRLADARRHAQDAARLDPHSERVRRLHEALNETAGAPNHR